MREESHLDDMRAAIRGDFDRLAKRLGGQELMQEPTSDAADETDEPGEPREPDEKTKPEPAAAAREQEPETVTPDEEGVDEAEEPRKGFFARLLGL